MDNFCGNWLNFNGRFLLLGTGAMAEVTTIAEKIEEELEKINGINSADEDLSNIATNNDEGQLL